MGWRFLLLSIQLFQLLILVRVILSWVVSPVSRNPAVEMVRRITDTVLAPIRSILPPMGGWDFTPMLALVLLSALQNVIIRAMPY
ncbi:MAG TPA: YggT family protein [Longimicrobiaceae bacterium]|nr:YggT family protein [Longimicrobiaceae bacterium]